MEHIEGWRKFHSWWCITMPRGNMYLEQRNGVWRVDAVCNSNTWNWQDIPHVTNLEEAKAAAIVLYYMT